MSKRVSWDFIVKNYPDKWAFIKDVKRNGSTIIDCELICIVPFDKMATTAFELRSKGIKFERIRTTESGPSMGVIL